MTRRTILLPVLVWGSLGPARAADPAAEGTAFFESRVRPLLAGLSPTLRRGSLALIVAGACAVVDGAFPLSCAESLPGPCQLSYDAVDIVHVAERATHQNAGAFFRVGLFARQNRHLDIK